MKTYAQQAFTPKCFYARQCVLWKGTLLSKLYAADMITYAALRRQILDLQELPETPNRLKLINALKQDLNQ